MNIKRNHNYSKVQKEQRGDNMRTLEKQAKDKESNNELLTNLNVNQT